MNENEIRVCADCGRVLEASEAYEIDGEIYCLDCLEQHGKVICRECGELVDEADAEFDSVNGNYVCDDCMDGCERCEHCGEIVCIADICYVNNGEMPVCHHCVVHSSDFYRCDECGGYFTHDRIALDNPDQGMSICRSCADEYCVCDECGDIIRRMNAHWDGDEIHCTYCHDAAENHIIWDYHERPTYIFRETDHEVVEPSTGAPLYLGVELEADNGNPSKVQTQYDNHVYYNHDGSLSENGVEIISHPATLAYHMELFPWDRIISDFLGWGFRSHDAGTCGLHVHVNRSFFGQTEDQQDLNIAKVVLLVNRFYDSHLTKFARRGNSDWARKLDCKPVSMSEKGIADEVKNTSLDSGRYMAVNLQNRQTIEFRLFKGTLKQSTFFATLQFVDAICRFAKTIDLRNVDCVQWDDIFRNVDCQKNQELFDYMDQLGLDAATPVEDVLTKTVPWEPMFEKDGTGNLVDFGIFYLDEDAMNSQLWKYVNVLNSHDRYFLKNLRSGEQIFADGFIKEFVDDEEEYFARVMGYSIPAKWLRRAIR